jgi:hypothetical protein
MHNKQRPVLSMSEVCYSYIARRVLDILHEHSWNLVQNIKSRSYTLDIAKGTLSVIYSIYVQLLLCN